MINELDDMSLIDELDDLSLIEESDRIHEPPFSERDRELAHYFASTSRQADSLIGYMAMHREAAEDCYQHDGCLLDLDTMITMEQALGRSVSFNEYSYANHRYPGDLLALAYMDDATLFEPLLIGYAGN